MRRFFSTHKFSLAVPVLAVVAGLVVVAATTGKFTYMKAEYSAIPADIGIPGISTMYEARLKNVGILPFRIQVCEYTDDTFSHGSEPAYSVERLESDGRSWRTVADLSVTDVCRPYPLGWIAARIGTRWLWPGQSLWTEPEATAARGFHKGDFARFVLYDKFGNRKDALVHAFPTSQFQIQEEVASGGEGLRIKH